MAPWIIPAAIAGGSALLGGLMGGKGGSTTQSNEPWMPLHPYLANLFGGAQGLYNRGGYGGPFLAPQSPYSQQAISGLASQAQDPNSLVSQAQGELGRTLSGQYLTADNNPAIQAAVNASRRSVNSQFSGDNYGGSANQEWMARGATEAAMPYLAQERQNQLNAMQMAPGLQQANLQQLGQAGAMQEARGQAEIGAAQQAHQSPWQNLFNFQQALGGGGTQGYGQQSSPYFTNPMANAFGMGMGGLAMWNQFNRGGPSSGNAGGMAGGGYGGGGFGGGGGADNWGFGGWGGWGDWNP